MSNLLEKIEVREESGILVTSSLNVASVLGKEHKHLLESIDNIVKNTSAEMSALFINSSYIAKNGKKNRRYLITEKGLTLYLFNVQGYNDEKIAYINKFESMKKALQSKQVKALPSNYKEALIELVAQVERNEVLELEASANKPKVEMYDIAMKSDDLLTMEQVAKIVNKKGYGRNNLFAFLRGKKVLQDDYNNTPYQSQINNGRFEVKEIAYTTPKGIERVTTKTLVTQKGLEYIIKLVDKDIKGVK